MQYFSNHSTFPEVFRELKQKKKKKAQTQTNHPLPKTGKEKNIVQVGVLMLDEQQDNL